METSAPFTAAAIALIALLAVTGPAHAREARWVGDTLEGRSCDGFSGMDTRTDLFDYTDPRDRARQLHLVEPHHFTDEIRQLRHSRTLNNLQYTIGRFPNHHQALYSMIRYATEDAFAHESREAWAGDWRGREIPPTECYLQRAIDFAPEDHRVRLLAGLFFHRKGIHDTAETLYQTAIAMAPRPAEAHYNYGLLLTDLRRFDEARDHARQAYGLGYPLAGLRQRLVTAGYTLDD